MSFIPLKQILSGVVAVQMQVGKEFPDRVLQKGVSLLRTKNRENVGTVNAAGRPPGRPGKVNAFHGLADNFYSLKIIAGRLALGDWLGHYCLPWWPRW